MAGIDGMRDLVRKLEAMDTAVETDGLKIVIAAGEVIKKAARANVRKNFTNRSGALEGDIEVRPQSATEVEVGTENIVYARIQELGGEITPKNKQYLAFEIEGVEGSIFTKRVYLPPRPYLRPAVDAKTNAARLAAIREGKLIVLGAVGGGK